VSERMYTGQWKDLAKPKKSQIIPWPVFVASIALMIAWVLSDGAARHPYTIAIVITTGISVFLWSWVNHGIIWTSAALIITYTFTYLVELVGVNAGIPFGEYVYADTLGPKIASVPAIVPIAWFAMAIPTLAIVRTFQKSILTTALFGAVGLTAWDFMLDPWMVNEGHWTWSNPDPILPGLTGIPLTNFIGWLITSFLLMLLIDRLPKRSIVKMRLPLAVYCWQWLGGVIANLFFLDQAIVALYVGVGMALIAAPALFTQYLKYR